METRKQLLLAVFATFSIIHLVQSQNQQGFISLDCGLPSNESSYTERSTNLTYTSDAGFTKGGKTGKVERNLEMFFMKPYTVLRYFPDGIRNCYTLNVTQDTKYLIRTVFLYGNYDGLNTSPNFDLYLGPNIWATVDVKISGIGAVEEIIHITRSNVLDIGLVKTGITTPLISTIELRPLRYNTYVTRTGSLKRIDRVYFTKSETMIRYPEDIYDRIWFPYFDEDWTQITTTLNVNDSSEGFDPPRGAITTAAIPTNASEKMTIAWLLETIEDQTYGYIYFADIQQVPANETREFELVLNDKIRFKPYRPEKFNVKTLYLTISQKCEGGLCRLQLTRTSKSTLLPIMNAFEIFRVIEFPQSETNQNEVIAIKNIEATYGLSRINWQGDPCVPKQFMWTGLRCSVIDVSTPPRIIALDLSSSGLSGVIPHSIQNLTHLQELDLSKNNLTGEVPEFLAKIKSLLVINLSGNNLSGSVPRALLDRQKEGLKLLVEGNINLCVACHKKFPLLAVVASVSSVVILIIILVLIFFFMRGRKPSPEKVMRPSLDSKNRRFNFEEVKEMTSNFQVVLGKGGFGVVCHGLLNNEQVAVKVLSYSSTQGYKEFKTEVELLLRVHHVNLVSLIGYCDEGNDLALIYEYMAKGDLKEHLSGKHDGSLLNWSSRLRIAAESALGIEYLHIGCKPPMVHRDVKSTNILLGEKFEAKLADFGLSRSFLVGSETHVSTVVAGTPGYLDPEYYQNSWLTEKSDVYSFGIVLLEIISGQAVIDQSREKTHIVEWVKSKLTKGDIETIMDPNLRGDYDTSSTWKALELAMSCVQISSKERPNMSLVVHELNECLGISENLRKTKSQGGDPMNSQVQSIAFNTDTIPEAR